VYGIFNNSNCEHIFRKKNLMDLTSSLVKMFSSLAVVLALVLLAAGVARRWLGTSLVTRLPRQSIRMASSLALGGRRSVLVLEIAGRTLVIGATPQQLVLLTQFDKADPEVTGGPSLFDSEFLEPRPPSLADSWQERWAHALSDCRQRFSARSPR
jgi:flagellar biogenesis protein FliO